MRLGQLARKLNLRPAEIIEFLATKNIPLEDDANSKVADNHVMLVFQQFAPGETVEDLSDAAIPPVDETIDPVEPSKAPIENSNDPSTPEPEAQERNEVIKAPKIELSGLKVLGKIDLPEPRKKQPDAPAEGSPQERHEEVNREKRGLHHKRKPRPAKNPIALQREREALAAQKKREEELQQRKERRTQNYLKKVKSHQPTKAARLVKEQAEDISSLELTESPKTWFGKFIRWLTT